MADPSQAALAAPQQAGVPVRPKYRIRFMKAGDLRLVSHHDLMHCFERMLRRAQIPVAASQGFHPKPKLVFALSLALGIVGINEVLELELTEEWPAEELLRRLREHAPAGLSFHAAHRLGRKSSAQVRRAFYRLHVEQASLSSSPTGQAVPLEERCDALLSQPHLIIERCRPQPRRIDLRPFLSELRLTSGDLEMGVWVTPHGTARPEEVAGLLGLEGLLAGGAYFERTDLEMLDEVAGAEQPAVVSQTFSATGEESPAELVNRGTHRPTPLLSGPLSFDS